MLAKGFPLVNIGDVYFDKGNRHAGECVAQGHAGMREPPGIDHDSINTRRLGRMNAVNQRAFVVEIGRAHV